MGSSKPNRLSATFSAEPGTPSASADTSLLCCSPLQHLNSK
jgi:hypothetical protein